jgi:hypothetical protein
LEIPEKLFSLANYYLKKRLFIVNTKNIRYDPRVGRPVPYLVFWFSDALQVSSEKIINQLALSLYYISIVVSIRDDLVDGRVTIDGKTGSEHAHVALANYFYGKYYQIFADIFPPKSIFWSILTECLNLWFSYETWSFIYERQVNFYPLSNGFLRQASSYLVWITLPTIAAIAIVSKNQPKLLGIRNFLRNYCMGWKIVDDLRDWRKDLNKPSYNHSTIMYHAMNFVKNGPELDAGLMESIFFDKTFIRSVYGSVLENYANAKRDARSFKSDYLTEFMNTQMDFYAEEKDSLLEASDMLTRSLSMVLKR